MIRILLCMPLFLLGGCPPLCFAQTLITDTKVQVVSGLQSPQVVGDAVIISGDSKPVITSAALIEAKRPVAVQSLQIPSFEPAQLARAGENRWLLVGSGSYLVIAFASDPAEIEYRKVELEPTPAPPEPKPPEPEPGPTPDPPSPDTLSPVAKSSREAMQVFVQSMAGNFNQLASETKLGKFKTVFDARGASNTLDIISRNQFKAAMARVMEPKLGSGALPADAAQTFEEIAIGFKGVK